MTKHTTIFLLILLLLITYAVFATYKRSFIDRDFILVTEEDEELDALTLEPLE